MNNHQLVEKEEDFICADCGSHRSEINFVDDIFDYGTGNDVVHLTATVPIRVCMDCDEEYLTEEGAVARHNAICKHLNLLNPAELKEAREVRGLTKVGLAEISGLGVASISRWESGQNLQTKANDNYLRLLLGKQITDNFEFIKQHNSGNARENYNFNKNTSFKGNALNDGTLARARRASAQFSLRGLD
jgi:DNA-binding transcriptional regulator YiaG